MAFPEAAVAQLLANCKRHCCVCWRWCGSRIHLHHIVPRADGGPDTIDNAIPVCLDCHAEIESRSNMGRHFSQAELREHKRRWLEICHDQPGVVIQSGRRNTETGPLEALLSELQYNKIALAGDDHRRDYATPMTTQFDRAIGANALDALEDDDQNQIFQAYKALADTADLIRARAGHFPGGNTYNTISNDIRDCRNRARGEVELAMRTLRNVLGTQT